MGFLDNSGDIILDAVLTDTGRFRLAKGDGSFKIIKYAFADDEIDYNKFDKNHASGSAYYDLDILKTPVLEAFTNNTSMMKHKLMSIPRNNLLYLPVILLYNATGKDGKGFARNATATQANGAYVVAVDLNTEDELDKSTNTAGLIFGATMRQTSTIRLDQGLNTTEISKYFPIDPDLRETRFLVEIDNRLGYIASKGGSPQTPHFIDDDQIASYSFSTGVGTDAMIGSLSTLVDPDETGTGTDIQGPRGNYFHFTIRSSLELETSEFLFSKIGSSIASATWSASIASGTFPNVKYIDTNVRVTGATTGYTIDIPIRFVKVSKS